MKTIIVAVLALAISGCSSASKNGKGSSTATIPSTVGSTNDSFAASTKQLQQDFTKTQTDLGKLESEIKMPK